MDKNAERRSSLRRPIHHKAQLCLDRPEPWPCMIADYCSEGMFIKFDSNTKQAIEDFQQYQPDRVLKLRFVADNEQVFEINLKLVHLLAEAMGVRFLEACTDAVKSLMRTQQPKDERTTPEGVVKQIVSECIDYIQQYTSPMIEELCPQLISQIKTESVSASSDQLSNTMMAIAEQLEHKQSIIQDKFSIAIQDPIGSYQQSITSGTDMSERLSLIDKGEFEDWLISRVLITRSETSYRNLLLSLKVRLDFIGICNKSHPQCVFGPSLLVSAFQSAMSAFSLGIQVEKIVFKVFEQQVMVNLESLYKGLNEILIRHGILPKVDLSKMGLSKPARASKKSTPKIDKTLEQSDYKAPPASVSSGSSSSGSSSSGSSSSGSSNSGSPSLGRSNSGLASTGANHTASAQNNSDTPAHGLSHSEQFQPQQESTLVTSPPFMNADVPFGIQKNESDASFKQNQENAQTALTNAVGLMRSLRAKGGRTSVGSQGALGSPNTGAENAAAATGEHVPTQQYSHDELAEGLSNLQAASIQTVPSGNTQEEPLSLISRVKDNLIKSDEAEKGIDEDHQAAIDVVDRFFFSMRKNPRISTEAKEHLFKLEVPVLKVLLKDENFFEDHSSSVRAVMNRIAQLGAKGSRLNPASSKRVRELVHKIVEEFEQDTGVFDYVLDELNTITERHNQLYVKNVQRVAAAAEGVHKVEEAKVRVAQSLNSLLQGRSVPSAVLTLIEEGWKDLLSLIYIQEGEDSKAWREYLAVIERLIEFGNDPSASFDMKAVIPKVQEGLKRVSGGNEPSNKVREALKSLIQLAPKGQQSMVQDSLQEVPETEDDVTRRNIQKSNELKPWILRVKAIEAGTWLQLKREGDDPQYMRLVWVAKGYNKFVFVNHQGMKVIELGLFKFAAYLKEKRIIVELDYELPMVNQGLDDMVKNVYDKLAYESTHDEASGLIKKPEFCRQTKVMMKSGKRTASCSLIYIRFVTSDERAETASPLSLDDAQAKKVVTILSALNEGECVLGRVSTCDFVLFSVGPELDNLYARAQKELGLLCQHVEFQDHELDVCLGESRAHLGFNNPESMIRHALKPISEHMASQSQKDQEIELSDSVYSVTDNSHIDKGAVQNTSTSDAISNETGLIPSEGSAENEAKIPTLEPVFISEGMIDEAANTALDKVVFEDLSFEIYMQKAKYLSNKVEGKVNAKTDASSDAECQQTELPGDHVNLMCFLKGSAEIYEPEDEMNSRSLDTWWLQQLLRLHKERHPLWDGIDYVRVKLSCYAFQDSEFTEQLLSLLETACLDARKICFDLYDCSGIHDIHDASLMMRQLTKAGFRFCLDQFGSERSPFALLKVLPVEMIKIDEAFMATLNQEDGDEVAADSIVEIAHYLGKQVLATSVDSAICLQKMKHLKVDYAQGTTVSELELL